MVLVVFALAIKRCNNTRPFLKEPERKIVRESSAEKTKGLNRNPTLISYTRHSKCRMACRQIDESEIADIIHNGTINYKKSNLQLDECKKRYAVEGYSKKDQQHIRIIVAPCSSELTVITCIDLDKDWACDCDPDLPIN